MNAPHVTILDNGDVQLRLSPEQARVLASHDTTKVWALQDAFRSKLFVAQCEAACRSEAVTG